MKKVKKQKPGKLTAGIQTRMLQKVQVKYSTDQLPMGVCSYQIDAIVIPPAGASGIPLATIVVLENGITRNPLKDSQMVFNQATGTYSASRYGAPPQSRARIWGEVTVTWLIPQTEKATSVIQTVP